MAKNVKKNKSYSKTNTTLKINKLHHIYKSKIESGFIARLGKLGGKGENTSA